VTQNGAREFGKEAFDEVEPGAVLGSKSEFEAMRGLIGKPSLGFLGDVRGMIVEDQLDRSVGRIGGVEKLEEFDEFAAAWRSLTRALTLPVRRSMPASGLIVPWRLYNGRRSRRSLSRRFRSSTPSSRWSARSTARHPKRAWPRAASPIPATSATASSKNDSLTTSILMSSTSIGGPKTSPSWLSDGRANPP
jgi:hypothetical protein